VGPQGHSTLTKRLAFRATGAPRVLHATLRAKSAPRVWKGATEEGARWSTLKSLHWGSRGQSKDGTLEDGRAFVLLAKGIPTGIKYPYSNAQYAPEGMGPRSGAHDGKGARKGHSCQRTHKVAFLHRMTPKGRRVFAWSGSQKALAKSSSQKGGVGTVGKVTRRDDLSGLLVAVLDLEPTDKRTYLLNTRVGVCSCPTCLWQEGY
jgi:hypothetical protein